MIDYNQTVFVYFNAEKQELITRIALLFLGSLITIFFLYTLLNQRYEEVGLVASNSIQPANLPQQLLSHNELARAVHPKLPISSPKPVRINAQLEWLDTTTQAGDTLKEIFAQYDLHKADLQNILRLPQAYFYLTKLKPDHKLRILRTGHHHVKELTYQINSKKTLIIEKGTEGYDAGVSVEGLDTELAFASAPIDSSLYLAAKNAHLSPKITIQLSHIFGAEIDFSTDIHSGDHFSVLYQKYFKGDQGIKSGQVIAAFLLIDGKKYKAIRYRTAKNQTAYYTPAGKNLEKAFLRSPIHYVYISSRFNLHRKHPILHIVRPHDGVDLAANVGTPIHASSSGTIIFKGWEGGYGRMIKIRNTSRITTYYAHMSRYAKGIKDHMHVEKGQVIGYVGQSGLTTGPHLHYEFRINGKPVAPMKVKLPEGKPIPKRELPQFHAYVQRVLRKIASDS